MKMTELVNYQLLNQLESSLALVKDSNCTSDRIEEIFQFVESIDLNSASCYGERCTFICFINWIYGEIAINPNSAINLLKRLPDNKYKTLIVNNPAFILIELEDPEFAKNIKYLRSSRLPTTSLIPYPAYQEYKKFYQQWHPELKSIRDRFKHTIDSAKGKYAKLISRELNGVVTPSRIIFFLQGYEINDLEKKAIEDWSEKNQSK